MLYFPCPHCNKEITAPDSQAGTEQLCNKCEQPIIVPGGSSTTTESNAPVSSAFDELDFDNLTGTSTTPVSAPNPAPIESQPAPIQEIPASNPDPTNVPNNPTGSTAPQLESADIEKGRSVVDPPAAEPTPAVAPTPATMDEDPIPLMPVQAADQTAESRPTEQAPVVDSASVDDSTVPELLEDDSEDELELMPAEELNTPNIKDQYVEIQEFSVKCAVCETVIMVSTNQIGGSTQCPDCYTDVPITKPVDKPLTRLKPIDGDDDMFGLEAPLEQKFEPLPGVTPVSRSVKEHHMDMLAQAQAQYQKEVDEYELDDNEQWVVRLAQTVINAGFLAFTVITTMMLWLGLCVMYYRPEQAGAELQFAQVFCTIIGILIVLPALLMLASTFIVICRETAAGDLGLVDWPPIDLMEWLANLFFVAVAAFFSYLPALPFAILFFMTIEDPGSYWWIIPNVLHLITFSFVSMSMMSTGTMTRPISGDLIKAIADRPGELSRFLAYAIPFSILLFVFADMAIDHEFVEEYKIWTYFFGCLLFTMTSFLFARNLGLLAFYVAKPADYEPFNKDDDAAE